LLSKDEKLSKEQLKEIQDLIAECGGDISESVSTNEIKDIMKKKKEDEKKKRKAMLSPFDDSNWRM
jgi:hypothetical protein